MAVASTVTVNITAETAKFENGLKKAKKTSQGFGKAVAKGMKIAAVATAALGVALVALTKKSLETVDVQRKVARTMGTTQRVFAGLSLAADISGVAVASFTKALKKQQKAIVDANDGLLTQKRAFDRLGLSTSDLINLNVDEQFKVITQALGKVENATLKVGIASDIFGAKNTDLINILELGEDGLDHFINKVDELGIALTDRQTGNIEEANDAIVLMKAAFTGLGNQIAARVSPVITDVAGVVERLTARVTDSIPEWTAWAASIFGVTRELDNLTIRDLTEEMKFASTEMLEATAKVRNFKAELQEQFELGDIRFSPELVAEFPFLKRLEAQVKETTDRYNDLVRARAALQKKGEIVTPETGAVTGPGDLDATAQLRAFDAAVKATNTPIQNLAAKLSQIRMDLETNPLWSPELATKQATLAVDAYLEQLERLKTEQTAVIDQQKADFEAAAASVATPGEALQAKLAEIRQNLTDNPFWTPEVAERQAQEAVTAYIEGLKDLENVNEDIFADMNEFQAQAARNAQDIFAEFLFDPFEKGLDGMLKGFVDMLRKMLAQLLAQQLLTSFLGLFTGGAAVPSSGGGGGFVGPPAAIGGFRKGGEPILTGERGPELFTPGASGSIRPLGAVSVTQENNFGGGGGVDIATLIPILEENNKKVKAEILDAFDRGSFA